MPRFSFLTFVLAVTAAVGVAGTSRAAEDDELPLVSALPLHEKLPTPLAPGAATAAEQEGPAVPQIAIRRRGSMEAIEAAEGCFRFAEPNSNDTGLVAMFHSTPAVRLERIVRRDDGSPALEIVDAWIDASKGSHLARTFQKPLAVVARGPHGAVAYAYRSGTSVVVLAPGVRTKPKAFWVSCAMTQVVLDAHAKEGDEAHASVRVDDETTLALSASVARFGADRTPRLAVSFSSD